MEESSSTVITWWILLSCVAFLNIGLLVYSYRILKRKMLDMTAEILRIRNWQLWLSSAYVIGCGFRSVFPRGDLRRIVMVDSFISAVVIGRSVATIAELAFVAQWAWILWEIGRNTGNKTTLTLSRLIVPTIVIAEGFSWYACTTKNYMGTAIEESLWVVAACMMVWGLWISRNRYEKKQRNFIIAGLFLAVGYIIYMVTVDVPAYINNYIAAEAAGVQYLGVWEGLKDVTTNWIPIRTYAAWEYEMIWMSLYFSTAVWISLYIMNGPRMDQNLKLERA